MTSETKWVQISELNERVKLQVRPSAIQGVGVFALRELKKGEKLYLDHFPVMYNLRFADFGKLDEHVRSFLLERWPNILNGSVFAYPDCRYSAFMNHSDTPNADAINDVALADIQAGEELTEDYRLILNSEKIFTFLGDNSLDKENK